MCHGMSAALHRAAGIARLPLRVPEMRRGQAPQEWQQPGQAFPRAGSTRLPCSRVQPSHPHRSPTRDPWELVEAVSGGARATAWPWGAGEHCSEKQTLVKIELK